MRGANFSVRAHRGGGAGGLWAGAAVVLGEQLGRGRQVLALLRRERAECAEEIDLIP